MSGRVKRAPLGETVASPDSPPRRWRSRSRPIRPRMSARPPRKTPPRSTRADREGRCLGKSSLPSELGPEAELLAELHGRVRAVAAGCAAERDDGCLSGCDPELGHVRRPGHRGAASLAGPSHVRAIPPSEVGENFIRDGGLRSSTYLDETDTSRRPDGWLCEQAIGVASEEIANPVGHLRGTPSCMQIALVTVEKSSSSCEGPARCGEGCGSAVV
jgi:hypothetical protein